MKGGFRALTNKMLGKELLHNAVASPKKQIPQNPFMGKTAFDCLYMLVFLFFKKYLG